jgi:hypothetical protein
LRRRGSASRFCRPAASAIFRDPSRFIGCFLPLSALNIYKLLPVPSANAEAHRYERLQKNDNKRKFSSLHES